MGVKYYSVVTVQNPAVTRYGMAVHRHAWQSSETSQCTLSLLCNRECTGIVPVHKQSSQCTPYHPVALALIPVHSLSFQCTSRLVNWEACLSSRPSALAVITVLSPDAITLSCLRQDSNPCLYSSAECWAECTFSLAHSFQCTSKCTGMLESALRCLLVHCNSALLFQCTSSHLIRQAYNQLL